MTDAPAHPVQLLVIDDHAIVRQGVALLVRELDWVAGCRGAADLDEALGLMAQAPADVAVVDLSLKRQSGLDAIEILRSRWPRLAVVVLSMHTDPIHCQRALQRGALGFVAKDDATDELAQALAHAAQGVRYLSTSVRHLSLGQTASRSGPQGIDAAVAQLTPRERQILGLIGRGLSAQEIAADLGRSVKTIEAHRNNLREKLGLGSHRQLLQFSAKWVQFEGPT